MTITINPSQLKGTVYAPPSKSDAHRTIIAAALADGISNIGNIEFSEDIKATLNALRAIGTDITEKDGSLVVKGGRFNTDAVADCNESGTTLRLMIPIVSALGIATVFTGKGRLPSRPYAVLAQAMTRHGAVFSSQSGLPLTVSGKLSPGSYEIAGDVSSQYISGLLFALPMLDGDSSLTITGGFQSASYVDMTLATLKKFGINVAKDKNIYYIGGNQSYKPQKTSVEGDFSNAAFWLTAKALGADIDVRGLGTTSRQGDRRILEYAKTPLKPFECDVSDIPDLAPIISLLMARGCGKSTIKNASRLRLKESDRFAAVCEILQKIGVTYNAGEDFIQIEGNGAKPFKGAGFNGHNDHRIVMTSAIAALFADGESKIYGAEAVNKSYPSFFEVLRRLGGKIK